MRAVNLIPGDQRADAAVGSGRSGGVAYALLGLLAAIAILAVLYGKASRQISSQRSEVATLESQAQRAQSEAAQLAPYTSFASMREQRQQAVAALVDSRFDWAHAFHEFGRVLSAQTSITALSGTIGAASETASSSTSLAAAASKAASATPPGSVPTFTLAGCATNQDAVAQMLQRLRLIDGVAEVTLQNSTKNSGSGAGGSSGGCDANSPDFSVGITFDPLPSTTAAAAAKTGASTVADQSSATSPTVSSGGKAG